MKFIFGGTGDTFTDTGTVDLIIRNLASLIFNGTYSGGVNNGSIVDLSKVTILVMVHGT